jgi:hypothetical protein
MMTGKKAPMQTVLTWSLIPLRLDVLDDVYYMKEEMDYTMQQHNYFSVDTDEKYIESLKGTHNRFRFIRFVLG